MLNRNGIQLKSAGFVLLAIELYGQKSVRFSVLVFGLIFLGDGASPIAVGCGWNPNRFAQAIGAFPFAYFGMGRVCRSLCLPMSTGVGFVL